MLLVLENMAVVDAVTMPAGDSGAVEVVPCRDRVCCLG